MSNEKLTTNTAANDPVAPAVRGHGKVTKPKKPVDDVKVMSFEIDDDDDFGGDPYNRTGSHCVLKFTEDS